MNYHPWQPISNPRDLKTLGKLAEECGELNAAIARCIIQGVEEKEPVTGKLNVDWLQEEIADVFANCSLVIERFGLDLNFIRLRQKEKEIKLDGWHRELK